MICFAWTETRKEFKIQNSECKIFELKGAEFIELNNLLKVLGLCSSGGEAKMVIAQGLVRVSGEVELRKRCKIRPGQVVAFEGQTIEVR